MTIFTTILKGIFSLHQLGLFHRGLQTEEIYIHSDGTIGIGGLTRIKQYIKPEDDSKVSESDM